MSITAYTGLPGHGKSYGVVENVIAPALEEKRTVVTNIPMNSEECLKRFGMQVIQIDINDAIENENFWEQEYIAGSVIVLDELWRLWPSGLTANKVRQADKTFLAEHRHMVGDNGKSTEIVFVTQDLGQIANFARCLVETTFRVTKLSKVGLDKNFRVDVYFGPVTGANPPISKRDSEIQGRFKKEIYALYKSHTKSKVGSGDETRTDKRFRLFGGYMFKVAAVFCVVAFLVLLWGFSKVRDSYGSSNKTDVVLNEPHKLPVSSTPGVNTQLKQYEPKAPTFKFLSKADEMYIAWNNGHFPDIDYRFSIRINQTITVLSEVELKQLSYKVKPVNECLVRVTGDDYNGVFMCKHEEKRQWFQEVIDPNQTAARS